MKKNKLKTDVKNGILHVVGGGGLNDEGLNLGRLIYNR